VVGCTWPLSGEISAVDDGDQDASYDLVEDFGQLSMIEAGPSFHAVPCGIRAVPP